MAPRNPQSPRQRRSAFETLEPRIALAGAGLTGQYFHNADFTGLADERVEAVAHNWGSSGPGAGVDAESFSVRWTGQVEPEFSESYTFRVLSDEGVRLWVDGRLIIDDWTPHVVRQRTGTIFLEAGRRHDIRLDYYESQGAAQIELRWSSPSQPLEIVPAVRLYESPLGLLGMYRDETAGYTTRIDPTVDFTWSLDAPAASLDPDGFTIDWVGQIRADFSENYTFSTISDDGVRLRIGNEIVIDDWSTRTAQENTGSKWLEAGKWYDIRLAYFDASGPAEVELRWSSARQTGGISEVVPQSHLRGITAEVVENPLGVGADPFVSQWEGKYHMTRSNGVSVWIDRADRLEDIHSSSPRSDSTLAWDPPNGTNYDEQVWAPELHRIADSWYIYVAASDGNNANHRMHVLQRNDPDPFGPYTYLGQLAAATDRWAIDGTVFQWQNTWYFLWSGWPGFTDGVQNIYIAEMRNPWTLRTDRALISTPQFAWEMHGLDINEGPQILIQDGQLHIIYSASGFWTPQYALGRLTYKGTGSLLSASSWTKAPRPVFEGANGVVGVGHASFTKSPDGTEDWIVYHAHRNPLPPSGDIRDVRIQPFTFMVDGTPDFRTPRPLGVPIIVPSASPDPELTCVIGDFNADGIVDSRDYGTWRATFGMSLFPGSSSDGSGDGVVDAADYVVWRRAQGSSPAEAAAKTEMPMLESAAPILKSQDNLRVAPQLLNEQIPKNRFRLSRMPRIVDVAFEELQQRCDDRMLCPRSICHATPIAPVSRRLSGPTNTILSDGTMLHLAHGSEIGVLDQLPAKLETVAR